MAERVLNNEAVIRLCTFVGVFAVLAVWEFLAPTRRAEIPRVLRWSNNLALIAIDTLVLRVAFPVLAVGAAAIAEERQWGLLNGFSLLEPIRFVLSFLILDLALYLQHVVFHAVPVLWRLHRMHHADLEVDVTTGVRFHPIEMVLSMGIKVSLVIALGLSPAGVLVSEVVLNATSMFNHSNVRISSRVDKWLRRAIVTPDMHRVHHSIHPNETNSNFGFNFSWWDRLLGTYRGQPADSHEKMLLGVRQFRTVRDLRLDRMLIQPFRGNDEGYAISQSADPDL